MSVALLLISLFLPNCCDASGSWCAEDFGPAVVAGQCIAADGRLEAVKTTSNKIELLYWKK